MVGVQFLIYKQNLVADKIQIEQLQNSNLVLCKKTKQKKTPNIFKVFNILSTELYKQSRT